MSTIRMTDAGAFAKRNPVDIDTPALDRTVTAADVIQPAITTVEPTAHLAAAYLLRQGGSSVLVVLDDVVRRTPIGILTDTDVAPAVADGRSRGHARAGRAARAADHRTSRSRDQAGDGDDARGRRAAPARGGRAGSRPDAGPEHGLPVPARRGQPPGPATERAGRPAGTAERRSTYPSVGKTATESSAGVCPVSRRSRPGRRSVQRPA